MNVARCDPRVFGFVADLAAPENEPWCTRALAAYVAATEPCTPDFRGACTPQSPPVVFITASELRIEIGGIYFRGRLIPPMRCVDRSPFPRG